MDIHFMRREVMEKAEDVAQPLDRPTPPLTLPLRPHHKIGDVKGNQHLTHVKNHLARVTEPKDTEERGNVTVAWMEEDPPLLSEHISFPLKEFRVLFR